MAISANNQLSATGYTYDASGNMLTDGRNTYTWNAESQLKTGAGVTYTYDGDGHRVEKSNGKLYWYGTGSDPLMETSLSGSLTDEYIFFGGKRIARRDSSNNVVYYAADHLGTSRVVASSAGAILDQSDFYPFGGERVLSASSGNTYKFTSKERDTESNLDNFGARYDSSILGRFMSPDPKILTIKHIANPQKWNNYAYTINNPLRYFDPDGMQEIDVQFRAFISASSRPDGRGNTFAGDGRSSTTAQNVTSRTTITVRIETDPSIRPGNPIISMTPGKPGETRQLDANGNIVNRATATEGLPTVTGSRDANGNAVLNFKESVQNPLEPPSVTPPIFANVSTTINQNGSFAETAGWLSGSPSFELNVGSTNIPLQSEPSSDAGFAMGLLFGLHLIDIQTPLTPQPPSPPPAATDAKPLH